MQFYYFLGASFDGDIFHSLSEAQGAIKAASKGVTVEEFENLKEGIEVIQKKFIIKIGNPRAKRRNVRILFRHR